MNTEVLQGGEAAEVTTGGDELTPAERAYVESRGESGLTISDPETPEPTAPTPQQAEQQPAADPDDPDGAIIVDEAGRTRDTRTGKFVPHGAFHKERTQRQALQTENVTLREQMARVNERLSILSQAFGGDGQGQGQGQPQPQQPAAPPDPTEDIFGYVKYLGDKLSELQDGHKKAMDQATTRINDVESGTAYRNDAVAFARETPDFGAAYQHLLQSIDRELSYRGLSDPKQRAAEITRLEREEIAHARQARQRPAEWIYNLAQMRGYVPQSGQQPAANPAQSPASQPASEPTPATDPNVARLAQLERGQRAAQTLSSAGGGAPTQLTADALANMSEAEFEAVLAKAGGSQNAALRRLIGG